MLPSEHRLRRREDFATAVRRGRRAGRPLLVVHLNSGNDPHMPGESAPSARAGFVVSKAVGGAVQRNLVKRRLRHLMRDRIAGLPPGSLVVVRALPGAAEAEFDRLSGDLDAALRRLSAPSPPSKAPR
ncbi:ribonuclease P protein component [Streptomyces polyrhachis]|uniref:Ribonuclease P protein component n=1 Tax=Streptomyces polyrhachis TaxID=1282885 RepID=A0ABW2GCP8_9ACTN